MGTAPAAVMEPMVVMDCVPVLRGRRESLAGRVKWVVMVRVVKLAPPTQMVTFVRAKVPATEMGLLPAVENAIVWLGRRALPVNCAPRIVTAVPASFVRE